MTAAPINKRSGRPHPRLLRYARLSPVSLDENHRHQSAMDFALEIYGANAVFSFIPKNGCTNLRYSIALANGAIAGPDDWAWIHKNNLTFRPTLRALATAHYTFTMLRCPFRRLVSAFLDRLVRRTDEGPDLVGHVRREARTHRLARSIEKRRFRLARRFGASADHLTFRSFVGMLETKGALMSNMHWAPQVRSLVYQEYDAYFRIEEFERAAGALREKIGLEVADTRALSGHSTSGFTRIEDEAMADVTVGELRAMRAAGRLPGFAALYDPDLHARVARLYPEDIALYSREFGAGALLPAPAGPGTEPKATS